MKLTRSVTLHGRTVEIWEHWHGGKNWHLCDYEIRVNGNVVNEFWGYAIFRPVEESWEYWAGLRFAGYQNNSGTPHWKHPRTGALYAANSLRPIPGPDILEPAQPQ